MPWIRVDFKNESARPEDLQGLVKKVRDRSWDNDEIVLFATKDTLGSPIVYYIHIPEGWLDSFSSAFASQGFVGVSSEPPEKGSVSLLVGDDRAWRLAKQ